MTCIITGCVAFNGHQWVGGDLHQIGNCFVFNCCMNSGEAAWGAREEWSHYTKEVDFSQSPDCWERRGTIVAEGRPGMLNNVALEYLS